VRPGIYQMETSQLNARCSRSVTLWNSTTADYGINESTRRPQGGVYALGVEICCSDAGVVAMSCIIDMVVVGVNVDILASFSA
jgi:hypothetical protein